MDKHKLNLNTTIHIFNVFFDEKWRIVKRTEFPGTVNWEMKYQNFESYFKLTGYQLSHMKNLFRIQSFTD